MKQSLTIPICVLLFSTPMYAAPCGIHGSAQKGGRDYTLNGFKNRSQAAHAINPSIILKRLARGDTFQNTQAAGVIGYVALVKPGGNETCNRKAEDEAHKDTPPCHWNQSSSPVSAMILSRYFLRPSVPVSKQLSRRVVTLYPPPVIFANRPLLYR